MTAQQHRALTEDADVTQDDHPRRTDPVLKRSRRFIFHSNGETDDPSSSGGHSRTVTSAIATSRVALPS